MGRALDGWDMSRGVEGWGVGDRAVPGYATGNRRREIASVWPP